MSEEKQKVREAIAKFSLIMEEKLKENDHKGQDYEWRTNSIYSLMNRLVMESGELATAINMGLPPEMVEREAADVANFVMMIADTYRHHYNGQ